MTPLLFPAVVATLLLTSLTELAIAQRNDARTSAPAAQPSDPALLPDQELGRRFTVKAEDLPQPKTGPVVASRPLTLPYQGQAPRVPEGFTATPFITGLEHPRRLLVLPNGDVLVAEQRAGHLTLLRDEDGDGKAEWIQRHVEGLQRTVRTRLARRPCPGRRPGRHLEGAAPARRVARGPRRRAAEGGRGAAGAAQADAAPGGRGADHQEGRVRHRSGPRQPAARDRSQDRRAVRRRRLVRQHRRRARGQGHDPALRRRRLEPDDVRVGRAQSDRRSPSIPRPAISRRWCRSATGSATAWCRTS